MYYTWGGPRTVSTNRGERTERRLLLHLLRARPRNWRKHLRGSGRKLKMKSNQVRQDSLSGTRRPVFLNVVKTLVLAKLGSKCGPGTLVWFGKVVSVEGEKKPSQTVVLNPGLASPLEPVQTRTRSTEVLSFFSPCRVLVWFRRAPLRTCPPVETTPSTPPRLIGPFPRQ